MTKVSGIVRDRDLGLEKTPMLHHVNAAAKRTSVNKSRQFHTSEVRPTFKPLQSHPTSNKSRNPELSQAARAKIQSDEAEVREGRKYAGQAESVLYFFDAVEKILIQFLSRS